MRVNRPLRLAIIGCGAIVENATLPALRRIGWLPRVLIDTSPRRLEAIATRMGRQGKRVIRASTWESVLDEFDAAIVALPHALHGAIGAALLKAGKHVFMEKPLATTTDQCRVMTTAAEMGRVALSVGLLRRYLRIARWTKALLESGVLGRVKYFEAREGFVFNSDPSSDALLRPDMAGGGVLLDTGAHTLDLVVWWFGDVEPLEYRDDSKGGVEADCVLDCRLASGGTGRIELSRTRPLRNSIRIEGTEGFVEVHLYKNEVLDGSPNALAFTHDGISATDFTAQFPPELFDAELRDFRDRALGKAGVGVSGEEATKSVDLIERCYRARRPLLFPWIGDISETSPISNAQSPALSYGSSVLVTGASGFIGGRLVERLVHGGARVRCAIRSVGRATRVARLPVAIAQVDLGSPADVNRALDGVEYVFHCAYDPRSRSQNIDGLRNLIDACASHSVRRLVHVSTFAVYEPFPDGPLTEETRDGDRSMVYVKTKLDLEKIVFERARDRRVPATIVQPSIVYGPFCKPWTNALAEMLIHGNVVLPDSGEGLCNAVYIDDLIDGLILAAVSPEAVGERFILSGQPVSWATFFNGFADALGVNPPDYWPRAKIVHANRSISRNVRAILADPRRFIKLAVNWGPTRQALRAGVDALPAAIRTFLLGYYYAGTPHRAGQTSLPDLQTLARYTFQAVASSRKAQTRLGYTPRFTFEKGMELTSSYLKWAYGDVLRSVQPMPPKRTSPTTDGVLSVA